MNCPTCQTTDLRIADRQGIEIDYCPQCRGVWLDRGELDKIIERSASSQPYREGEERVPRHRERDDDDYYGEHYGRRRKRRSFLDDLFDFG
jgi:uncharacterized protein